MTFDSNMSLDSGPSLTAPREVYVRPRSQQVEEVLARGESLLTTPMLRPTSSGRASRQSLRRNIKLSEEEPIHEISTVVPSPVSAVAPKSYRFGFGAPKPAFDLSGTGPTVPDCSLGPPSDFRPCEVPIVVNRTRRAPGPLPDFTNLETSLDCEFLKLFGC